MLPLFVGFHIEQLDIKVIALFIFILIERISFLGDFYLVALCLDFLFYFFQECTVFFYGLACIFLALADTLAVIAEP